MLKLVCLINRPVGMPVEDFRRWWLGHHAAVAAQLPGLTRYTISTSLPSAESEAPFDGVAELWFPDEATMDAAFTSPQGLACAREDRDLIGARCAFLTEEHIILC